MLTDWVLIGRLAHELEDRLRGGRVEDVGLRGDALALIFRRSGKRRVMVIDLFSSPPLVTVQEGELTITEEPGFVRALARSLTGMVLTGAASRRFDRLVRLRFASRSRFGVGDELDLYVELVPRFGNIVLVKDESIVAARKEFGAADNPRRAIQAGGAYILPPLPATPRRLGPSLESGDDIPSEPLFVYRRGGRIVQAYVWPLDGFADAEMTREASLLEVFAAFRTQQTGLADDERNQRRRDLLLRRLDERETKLRRESVALDAKRGAADGREELRVAGEQIFATLYALDESEREPAKERAAKLFAQYKKLGKSLPHIAQRKRAVEAALAVVETLRWECERAAAEDIHDVETAIDVLASRRGAEKGAVPRKRKRRMLELRTASGSRIAVGRSPLENAELTFHVARPDDLWFHAQGVPGAHVILSRDDRARIPDEDLETAASLAAFYSKARAATSAPVDYTQRKHVRKQRAAPPGLVWYTHAKTILALPQSLDSLEQR